MVEAEWKLVIGLLLVVFGSGSIYILEVKVGSGGVY